MAVPYFAIPYVSSNPCTVAINDDLIVVGTYMRTTESGALVPRPFAWLHDNQYGLAGGFHDLLDLTSGAAADEPGYANDISDAGVIVGGRGGVIENTGLYAFAWDLGGYSGGGSFAIPLDSQGNSAISWSMATAIEKFTTTGQPRIVGMAGKPICPTHWWAVRFALTSTSPTILASLTQPPDSDPWTIPDESLRMHFTDVAFGEGEVLDFDTPAGEPLPGQCTAPLGDVDECEFDFVVGAQLDSASAPIWLRIANYNYPPPNNQPVSTVVAKRITSARAVASDGWVGGCMQKFAGFGNCRTRPALWEDPQPTVADEAQPNLPRPSGVSDALVEGVGERTDCGVRRLVGWSPDNLGGVVWDACAGSGTPPDWCTFRILDLIGNPIAGVLQAFDLNSSGYVAVIVEGWSQSCQTERYVGVLGHRSDLDFDFVVGPTDLAILLGAWSASTACVIASADINGDSAVGSADLAILLGDWGNPAAMEWPCSGAGCTLFDTQMSSGEEGSGEIEAAIASLGFGSFAEFAQWCSAAEPEQVLCVGQLLLAVLAAEQGGER